MTCYYGDFPANHTSVCIPFSSFAAATGASSATSNFANTDILIYKNGGTTQRTSANGITVSTSFDSQAGLQMIVIDLSDNTDAGFYAAGNEYQVAVADITVDTQTVRFWVGCFSIERAGWATALTKTVLKTDMNGITGEAARSPLNALRLLRNKWTLSGTTLSVKKEDDSTEAWSATVTTDAGAEPITGNDPA